MYKTLLLSLFVFYNIVAFCQLQMGEVPWTKNGAKPLIVGHRGGSDTILPENSISLFDFTTRNTCYNPMAIEFDIRESASGSLYIMHDETVDRTTNGTGKINELRDTYLNSLILKDRIGNLTTEKIPLFSEVLSNFKNKNLILVLDVKGNILPEVIKQVQLIGMESKCILLTFSLEQTSLAYQLTTTIMISALVKNREQWNSLLELGIPSSRLIAYISNDVPTELIDRINDRKVTLMNDLNESFSNNSKYYEPDYYKIMQEASKLSIIITDFPVYVNKLFCN